MAASLPSSGLIPHECNCVIMALRTATCCRISSEFMVLPLSKSGPSFPARNGVELYSRVAPVGLRVPTLGLGTTVLLTVGRGIRACWLSLSYGLGEVSCY